MTAPDVILLDINMPIMNGDQFLKIMKADPKLASIPVLQLSASLTPQRPGTLGLISKPYDPDSLIDAIEFVKNTIKDVKPA